MNPMAKSVQIISCRTCSSKSLSDILDLGKQPLANALLDNEEEEEELFPLKIIRCENCGQTIVENRSNICALGYSTSSTATDYSNQFCDER